MATKSFFRNIVIKDKLSAKAFVSALENAENKGRKKIADVKVKNITNKETIKKMFGE